MKNKHSWYIYKMWSFKMHTNRMNIFATVACYIVCTMLKVYLFNNALNQVN